MGIEMNIKDLVIIDCEASGLSANSYPIEIGVAFNEESFGFLIKPPSSWDYWDLKAEEVHKIKREELYANGISVFDAISILNSQLRDLTIYSDASDYEELWINKLYSEVGISKNFDIASIYTLDIDWAMYKYNKLKFSASSVIHRAENDALLIRKSIIKSLL